MKNKSKRSRVKNANLVPSYNARVRQEYIDFDYIDKLNEEEKAWLNKFMGEYNNGGYNANSPEKNIHPPEYKKELYDKNNHQNNDLYGNIKAKVANTKLLNYDDVLNVVEEHLHGFENPLNIENAYVDYIEYTELKDMLAEYNLAMLTYQETLE